MAWVSWDIICLPKNRGGLGVKNLEAFNLALLSKWRWRILVDGDDYLWRRILVERYGEVSSWNGLVEGGVEWKKASLWWRDLKILGDGPRLDKGWFNELAKKKMGNGETIKFWTESWLGRESLASLYPSLYDKVEEKNVSVAEMGAWDASGWSWGEFRPAVMTAADAQAADELAVLLLGAAPLRDVNDQWRWSLDSCAGFTVKKCYCWLLSFFAGERRTLEDRVVNACVKLWRNDVPSKVLVFSWRLLLNKLATKDALARRGILASHTDLVCPFCVNQNETLLHLFFDCQISREVWRLVSQWLGVPLLPAVDAVDNFMEFGKFLKGKKRKRVKHLIWVAVTWCLWSTRNNILFKGEVAAVSVIVDAIKFSSWGWFMARSGRRSGVSWNDWLCSPMGCFLSL